MVNEEIAKQLAADLDAGDLLLWAAQPKQGLMFTTQDFFLLPFSMFGCGFAYFLMTVPSFTGAPQAVAYIGWAFMIVSLYFFLFRFLVDSALRAKTFYGLTAEYVVIKEGKKVQFIHFQNIKNIKCDENVDAGGNIWFEPQTTVQLLLGNSLNGLPFVKHPKALLFIPAVKALHNQIINLKKKT
jgi:hypothetical protein